MRPPQHIFDESPLVAGLLSEVLEAVLDRAKPGVTTLDLADACAEEIAKRSLSPAMPGLNNYPSAACVSINEQVLHAIPSSRRKIKSGDLVTVQSAVRGRSAYANLGWTRLVGPGKEARAGFVAHIRDVLSEVVGILKPTDRVGDLGSAIQERVEAEGYSVVREYCGYGMVEQMFCEPQLVCYGQRSAGPQFEVGSVLNTHVIATAGTPHVNLGRDGWTVSTRDRKDAAMFNAMVRVHQDSVELISRLLD